MSLIQKPLRNRPKCRVELHIHIDGAIRPETIWDLMRRKKFDLPGDGSLASLKESLTVQEPQSLSHFLSKFKIFLPVFRGDLEAMERFALEFVEDQAGRDVIYCEARMSPHVLLPDAHSKNQSVNDQTSHEDATINADGMQITSDGIVEAVLRGLKKGEEKYGTKVRLILCCLRGDDSETLWDVLRLCEEYRHEGVVGIDIAGNLDNSEEKENSGYIEIFEAAKKKGIHRTVHAGEESGWETVKMALDDLSAERIGHGYRTIENEDFYQRCLKEKVHFEMCPYSSYLTGAMKSLKLESKRHPILRLEEDGASYSINSDDPTVTGRDLRDDYELLRTLGYNEAIFARANFEAANRCFLPDDEKDELLAHLRTAYGVPDLRIPTSTFLLTEVKTHDSPMKPDIKIASWEERTF